VIYISRKEHFNAAHKLYNPKWSEEKNQQIFGECSNANWHGHNFELIVTVRGKPSEETGFIIDLKELSKLIQEEIIEQLDHKNLNLDVEFMKGKMATIEVLVQEIWNILAPAINQLSSNGELFKLTLTETKSQFVEYCGNDRGYDTKSIGSGQDLDL